MGKLQNIRLTRRSGFSWAEVSFAASALAVHVGAMVMTATGGHGLGMAAPSMVLFGIPSPTTGTTRAILSLYRGEVNAAFVYNPVAVIVALVGAAFVLYLPISALTGRKVEPSQRLCRLALWLGLGVLFAAWIWKLAFLPKTWW